MKGNLNIIWIIAALVIVVVTGSGLIGIANFNPASILASISGGGMTVLSTDLVTTSYGGQTFYDYWRINTVVNNGADSVAAWIDVQDDDTGIRGANDVQIDAYAVDQVAIYTPIRTTARVLYKLEVVRVDGIILPGAEVICPIDRQWEWKWPNSDNLASQSLAWGWCVRRYSVAQLADGWTNPTIKDEVDIIVTSGGQAKTTRISSDQTTGNLQGYGTVQYTGSLVTGTPAPNQNSYIALFSASNVPPRWQLAYYNDYTVYESSLQAAENELRNYEDSFIYSDWSNVQDLVNEHNYLATYMLNQDLSMTAGCNILNDNCWNQRTSQASGELSIYLDKKVSTPQLLFQLDADWVGVIVNTGTPRIDSLSSCDFESGTLENFAIVATNVGSSTGSFEFSVDCPHVETTSTGSSNRMNVGPGQQVTFLLRLTMSGVNQDMTDSCTATVTDIGSGASDSMDFSCFLRHSTTCNPGQYYVEGSCIYQCSQNGMTLNLMECCECGVSEGIMGTYGPYSCLDCNGNSYNFWDWLWSMLRFFVIALVLSAVIVGLGAFAFFRKLFASPMLLILIILVVAVMLTLFLGSWVIGAANLMGGVL